MTKAKVTATGSKSTDDDGVRTSTFSVTRNGPFRRAINDALDTLPPPSSLIPGKTKIIAELCPDGQIQIEYSASYRDPRNQDPRKLTASIAELSGNN